MKTIIFSILLLLSLGAHAETRPWTTEEKTWGAVAGTLLLADWSTTQNMSRRYNEGYYERNPLLGRHPSSNTINLYFLIATPLIFLAADQVPEYRKTILQATSALELIAVGNNLRIGLHFQF
jgi:hypothetical protein